MIKLKDMLNVDITLGKVYTDKDRPPFQVKEETLTEAKNIIYFSNSFNFEHRRQSEDRAHRSGLKHRVLYTDLICKGTIDERIISSLSNKNKLAIKTLGDEFKEWLT